ncbi:MAG: DNA-protecting protein DprA [Acidimicrobiales bacterium]|nr:DNA-protecting protein DprA [Acidimicrobiales bacterium]
MAAVNDRACAVLALCSRIVPSDSADPLKAKEYWELASRVDDVASLLGRSVEDLVHAGLAPNEATRCASLLDRASALGPALEELEEAGIWTAVAGDERYPTRLCDYLGPQAPPILHGAGAADLMTRPSLGVVGSRNVSEEGADVARSAARFAVARSEALISGGARGVDQLAMLAALEADGASVGVLAESLVKRLRESGARRAVDDDRLCLVTPYKPTAGFSVATAMGRNKVVYALSDVTLVVASDHDTGGTWAGAVEAIRKGFGTVAVWRGPGQGDGNEALVARGGHAVNAIEDLNAVGRAPVVAPESNDQLQFGL